MPGCRPNFLLVGAMKAGTTSIMRYLASHPDVYVPPGKEVHFFDREERWRRGIDWYYEQFDGAGTQRAIGEGSPGYMLFPDVAARMASVVPDARLIAILRDPVDRAHSHYLHARRRGTERRPFAEIVDEELELSRPRTLPLAREALERHHYVVRGLYLEQLENLCAHYPRDSLHVLLVEDLEREPRRAFRELCRFLEIDDAVVPDIVGSKQNPYFEPRSQRLWALLQRVRVWRRLPKRARAVGARLLRRSDQPPAMDPHLRALLSDYFAAPNAALGQWLGRDLSHWRSPGS
jgi:hypothetical protein